MSGQHLVKRNPKHLVSRKYVWWESRHSMQTDKQMDRYEVNSRFSQLLCASLCQGHGCMRCWVQGYDDIYSVVLCYYTH